MLIPASRLVGTPILSMQSASSLGYISALIVDPDSFKVIAFQLAGHSIDRTNNILDTKSIREYSNLGCVIDSADELVSPTDVIKINQVLELHFNLIGLKVETKKGTKLGHVLDYTVTNDNFSVQQIIVKRPLIKSFTDPELTIPHQEIIEITDRKIIIKDEEKTIRERALKEDFIPNFVNPFRKADNATAHADSKNPEP